ncbi:MAG: DUF3179 domain-containing protein [Burkholderiaceae bacterium]
MTPPERRLVGLSAALALGLLVSAVLTDFPSRLLVGTAAAESPAKPTAEQAFGPHFMTILTSRDQDQKQASLDAIKAGWHAGLVPMSLEIMNFMRPGPVRNQLVNLVASEAGDESKTGRGPNDWYFWLWNQPVEPPTDYAEFKADLFRNIDPKFERYFRGRQDSARIRLDEIRWGGVKQDGIPPLRNPAMLAAGEADYLADTDIVFGIEINGDKRAYPKRILAWHEMFTDEIGGVGIAGVYCTLCGTVIPFRTEFEGQQYELGTSGFLYRSNKLMYDKATQSLWSTTRGAPVLGPLVDQGIELAFESVVTTTWGEWRRRHPSTTVLSLETGHSRDYDEGAAYAAYFGTDKLMFNTPFQDDRLANKQEVLALRFAAAPDQQLAIDTDFLNQTPVYYDKVGLQSLVVLTDKSGANRVYDPGSVKLMSYDQQDTALDEQGGQWQVTEAALIGPNEQQLKRLPYRRAFWFGWHAAFPETRLVR